MTAKEFLKEHGIPNMPTQYSPQFQTDVNDTAKALEAYHQAKLKLLGISDVVRQSEQLKAFADYLNNRLGMPMYSTQCHVDDYLKSL